MRTRGSSRLLAPLALVACVVAVGAVAMTTMGGDSSSTTPTSSKGEKQSTSTTSKAKSKARTYTVKSDDTLSVIAEKTGVDVTVIIRLNPGVDPQSLRPGQKLKLRES
ncbi:MAG: LysM peptidoglycan-binding domain-containing protein [Solirubrobacteraceae bacterium]|nr:LysM peptidoglycan-binding domain-containing protein [Solirubrobacteraceae bacterium]